MSKPSELAAACRKAAEGMRIIILAPDKRMPELQTSLLEEGVATVAISFTAPMQKRQELFDQGKVVIINPHLIETGVSLKTIEAIETYCEDEIPPSAVTRCRDRFSNELGRRQYHYEYTLNNADVFLLNRKDRT